MTFIYLISIHIINVSFLQVHVTKEITEVVVGVNFLIFFFFKVDSKPHIFKTNIYIEI